MNRPPDCHGNRSKNTRYLLAVNACVLATGLLFGDPGDVHAATPGAAGPAEIMIPGERIFPESITSTADGRLIVGSIARQAIYMVEAGGDTAKPWISTDAPSNLGVLGVYADEQSQTLWACWSDAPGLTGPKMASSLVAYDLKSGSQRARYLLPTTGALCNDIAATPDGSVYVTDTENMEIDRLAAGGATLKFWAGHGAFGAKGGVLDGISVLGDSLYVNTLVTGKLFMVPLNANGKAGKPQRVRLSRPIVQPDGMRSFGKNSVLTVESGGPGRLSLITLHGATGQVSTLREGYPGGPVSVAVIGQTGYVLEGQLLTLFEPKGKNPPLTPFKATAVTVGDPP